MNISEMSDEEKSVILARLVGWRIVGLGYYRWEIRGDADGTLASSWGNPNPIALPDLYDPINMRWSWRILRWAATTYHVDHHSLIGEWLHDEWPALAEKEPADAQREWLDMVLRRAVEVGMVK